jgi:DNA-binding CsgD family transcriptional regulator
MSGAGANGLLERDSELKRLGAALRRATRGQGGVVMVEGGLGVGKTSVLRAAVGRAADEGCEVLQGRGAELERDFGFGVMRQLLERPLHAAAPERRDQLLSGAAELAAPALGLGTGQPGADPFSRLHGIYWLVAGLAEQRPLTLVVDDVHWADPDSLRTLSYVANRLDDLPVLLLLGLRQVPGETPLTELPPVAEHVVLAPLGLDSVAELVRRHLGRDGDAEFNAACHRVTAGNPLALAELLRDLVEVGVQATADSAASLEDRPPPRLARGIVARVNRTGPSAERLARALAVLGGGAELGLAGELAELEAGVAAEAATALAGAGIVAADAGLRFAHPLIQSTLYEEIPADVRSREHRRAAELVAGSASNPEAVAIHLLAVEPAGDGWVVEHLAAAAGWALGAGAPDAARRYLLRALDEPPPNEARPALLFQLGLAEVAKGDRASLDHLEEARSATADREQRTAIATVAAGAMTYFGEGERAIESSQAALAELDDHTGPAAIRLELVAAALMWQDAAWSRRFEASLPGLLQLVEQGGRAARGLALTLSAAVAARGEVRKARELIDRGLDGGAYLLEESINAIEFPQAVNGLAWCEENERALELSQALLAEARRQGSIFGAIGGGVQLGLTLWGRGDLAQAEAELTHADALAVEHGALPPAMFSAAYLAEVRLARGHAAPVAATVEAPPDEVVTSAVLVSLQARAAVRAARGDRAGAIVDLRATGDLLERIGITSPGVSSWRSKLALQILEDEPEEARALAESEVSAARAAGLRVAEGVALRALAATEAGGGRIEALEASVALLDPTFARLELARSLTDLGAALSGAGKPKDARPLLLRALDQAHRCAAQPLAERARAEAVAAGARPRRPRLTGVEALTPSELRVAHLASEGLSNREIAQALFVTTKTVADHLAATYRKLGISRRGGLTKALAEPTPNG